MNREKKTVSAAVALTLTVLAGTQAAVAINDLKTVYQQDFNSLPSSDTNLVWENNSTITGWYRAYTGAAGRDASVQTAGGNAGGVAGQDGFLNVGEEGSQNRSLVMRRAFSTDGAFGVVFQNVSGKAAKGFAAGYTGEQWRRNGTDETPLYFEYTVMSAHDAASFNILKDGKWTRVKALEFVSPQVSGGNSGVNGKLRANRKVIAPVTVEVPVADGQYLAVRWYQDRSSPSGAAVKSSHALGVDDVTVSFLE